MNSSDMLHSVITSMVFHLIAIFFLWSNVFSIRIPSTTLEIELATSSELDQLLDDSNKNENVVVETVSPPKNITAGKEKVVIPAEQPQEQITDGIPEDNILPVLEKEPVQEAPVPEIIEQKALKKEPPKSEVIKIDKKAKKRSAIADLLATVDAKDDSTYDELLSSLNNKENLGIKKGGKARNGVRGLTTTDVALVRDQVIPHWSVPAGLKNSENLVVELNIKLKDDGSVADIAVVDENRYYNDGLYRIAVDRAKRAILEASPLKIPRNKIKLFKQFRFIFDPRDALN